MKPKSLNQPWLSAGDISAGPFPAYDLKLDWLREGDGGNWYWAEQFELEGWLCPALFRYFDEAPREIYAQFLPKA